MRINIRRMEITTQIGCSINCKYCPQKLFIESCKRNGIKDFRMEIGVFKRCIDKLPQDVVICFAGMSEPWLNPECGEMLSYVVQKGFKIEMYTTLVGMKESDLEIIENVDFSEFVVHLPDEDNNSKIKVDDNYCNLLKKLVELNTKKKFITSYSYHGTLNKRISRLLGGEKVNSTELNDRAGNMEVDNVVAKKQKCGAITCMRSNNRLDNNVLLPDGTVILCCMDYALKHILGNLQNDSYKNILNSKESMRIREGLQNESINILCRKCATSANIFEICDFYQSYYSWAMDLYRKYEDNDMK